jgi:hypothetical protein
MTHATATGRTSANRAVAIGSLLPVLILLLLAAPALASEASQFGLLPESVTALTCPSAEVTCTATSPLETQAGANPTGTLAFAFSTQPVSPQPAGTFGPLPVGAVRDLVVALPPGFVGDPQAVPRCSLQTLTADAGCPRDAMVGYAVITTAEVNLHTPGSPPGTLLTPVYNIVPASGQTAQFAFVILGAVTHMVARVRTDGDYGVTITSNDIPADEIAAVSVTFWGIPAQHDGPGPIRVTGHGSTGSIGGPGAAPEVPFLTNPSDCSTGPLTTTVAADSWEEPGSLRADGEPELHGPAWHTATASSPQPTGCEALPFGPSLTFQPVTHQIDAPSGYQVVLESPQNQTVGGVGEADLADVRVTLPAGVSIDPSAADGLQGCSDAQYGYGSNEPVACPAASQIGQVEVETPLLAPHSLTGELYLGTPLSEDPQSGRMFRLFLALHGPGLLIKIPGSAVADPTTGRLTATFAGNPPLPFSSLSLRLNGGDRAPLANPPWCESSATTSELTSYAGQALAAADPLQISYDGLGTSCPASMPFSPGFSAGTLAPVAGASSPLALSVNRSDGRQTLSRITTTLPKGLLATLAGVPLCPAAQAAAGACPSASQLGSVTVAAGPGSHPFYVSGPVYLTAPYGGGPFGLAVAVPAVAGPFDLGTVVVRAAIHIDPLTAAVTVASDPLPQILDGIPLRLRSVNVMVNRPQFTFNPTSCTPQSLTATILAAQGATAAVSSPFDVGGCADLPFHPRFTVSAGARTTRASGASLQVKVASAPGQANIAKVDVSLPKALSSRLTTLQKACPEAQFAADPAGCPPASLVGVATALTPVLSAPLTGPAILVSRGGAAFPDLVLLLQGEGVTIELVGNTDIKRGVTYTRFDALPDAPLSSFALTLPAGPHSILAAYLPASAHGSLCAQRLVLPTLITGQSGVQIAQSTRVSVLGCPKAKRRTKQKRRTSTTRFNAGATRPHSRASGRPAAVRRSRRTARPPRRRARPPAWRPS